VRIHAMSLHHKLQQMTLPHSAISRAWLLSQPGNAISFHGDSTVCVSLDALTLRVACDRCFTRVTPRLNT